VNQTHALHEALQFLWQDCLITIAEGAFWMVMDIYQQSIGSGGDSGVGHRRDKIAPAS
jgi:hypothetical protein